MRFREAPILRRLIPSLAKRIAALTWPGEFKVVRRYGVLLLVNRLNYVDRQIAFYGDFERAQITRLLSEITRRGCDLFIDIGANIGLYTVLVAKCGIRVIAFEPDARNVVQLRANLLINNLTSPVDIHELGVSDRSATLPFAMASATHTGQSRIDPAGTGSIAVVALDDLFACSDQRIVLKIDIERHESAAIAGMAKLLTRNHCFLQIESFPEERDRLDAQLGALGYHRLDSIAGDHFYERAVTKSNG